MTMLRIFEQLEIFYRERRAPRMKAPRYAEFTETVRPLAPYEEIYEIRATWGVRTVIKDPTEKLAAIDSARTMMACELLADVRGEVIDCLDLLYSEGFRPSNPVFAKLDRLVRLLYGENVVDAPEMERSDG